MRQLVGHERHEALVACEDRGGREGEAGVLHAAEGKAGRQHENVVALPLIRPVELLDRLHHVFGIFKFAGGALHHRGLGVDTGALAHRLEHQVSDRQRNQVRRDRLRHLEVVGAGCGRLGGAPGFHLGAHHGKQVLRRADGGRVRDTNARGVLQRYPASRVNSLGLRVEERMLAARGVRRFEPLQARCVGLRGVEDPHSRGVSAERNGQRRSQDGIALAQPEVGRLEGAGFVPGLGAFDSQAARVEDQLTGGRVGLS